MTGGEINKVGVITWSMSIRIDRPERGGERISEAKAEPYLDPLASEVTVRSLVDNLAISYESGATLIRDNVDEGATGNINFGLQPDPVLDYVKQNSGCRDSRHQVFNEVAGII